MADNKGTSTRQDFPEVKDKIVEIVELSVESDYYGITIRFHDQTSLTFAIEHSIVTFPVYSQWTEGEETQLKRYQPVSSKILRT